MYLKLDQDNVSIMLRARVEGRVSERVKDKEKWLLLW